MSAAEVRLRAVCQLRSEYVNGFGVTQHAS